MRTHLRRLALLLTSTLACLALLGVGELWARRNRNAWEREQLRAYLASPTAGFELRPGFEGVQRDPDGDFAVPIRVNSRGTRGEDFTVPKPEGTFRIVLLGDSVVFGWGVREEESLPRVCERALRRLLGPEGPRVEVINAGVPGTAADQHYRYLVERALDWDPDLVVSSFLSGNDVSDLSWHDWVAVDDRGLPERITSLRERVSRWGTIQYRLANPLQSAFVAYLQRRFFHGPVIASERPLGEDPGEESPYRKWILTSPPLARGTFGEQLEKARRVYRGMRDACEAAGVAFAIQVFPHFGIDVFCPLAREEGMGFLSIHHAMHLDCNQSGTNQMFPHDPHWNPEGNRIAGEALARQLLPLVVPGRFRSGWDMLGCGVPVLGCYRADGLPAPIERKALRLLPENPPPWRPFTVEVNLRHREPEAASAIALVLHEGEILQSARLRDDGVAPDRRAGDRRFTARLRYTPQPGRTVLAVEPRDREDLGFSAQVRGIAFPVMALRVLADAPGAPAAHAASGIPAAPGAPAPLGAPPDAAPPAGSR